jgi:hypothetical protein
VNTFAYLPPSQFIIKTWANKHSGLQTVKVRSLVTAYDGEKPTDVHFKATTLFHVGTHILRSWASDDSDKKIFSIEKKGDAISLVSRLLLSSNGKDLIRALRDQKFPIRIDEELMALRTEAERARAEDEALKRWNNGIAWVIGTREDAPSQLWFEKDVFLPIRMIFTHPAVNDRMEFRFENYRFSKEFPYPRSLIVMKDGKKILLKEELIEFSSVVDTSSSHHGTALGTFLEGNSISSSVKNLIKLYYDVVR